MVGRRNIAKVEMRYLSRNGAGLAIGQYPVDGLTCVARCDVHGRMTRMGWLRWNSQSGKAVSVSRLKQHAHRKVRIVQIPHEKCRFPFTNQLPERRDGAPCLLHPGRLPGGPLIRMPLEREVYGAHEHGPVLSSERQPHPEEAAIFPENSNILDTVLYFLKVVTIDRRVGTAKGSILSDR